MRTAVTSLPAADKPICHKVIKRQVFVCRNWLQGFVPPEPEAACPPQRQTKAIVPAQNRDGEMQRSPLGSQNVRAWTTETPKVTKHIEKMQGMAVRNPTQHMGLCTAPTDRSPRLRDVHGQPAWGHST